ncbi:DUF4123 domain-containing protein [Pseudomonas sp. B2M1-30]|uniref:DUF4123 domain-containing protein n=1 Tax=Pseudomonas koreensis TaxID=198620 RepID=A0A9X2XRR0_9PSED|nr:MULTISPECIES: DUF4123 domain-containing protein [Pseudomonas]MCU0122280.1 DUF4123 domain-containing protein [Pseudomonas sp. B2M1-30]MCU7251921.1 DUF4123 domain-containing protein [Pseudomonas koreensis]MCU7262610.1 DUF4123 domain-containing protein [Pseudomonas koreensis]
MTQFRPSLSEWLTTELWPQGSGVGTSKAYALLDGARDPRIEPLVRTSGAEFSCLYAGKLSTELSAAAPYLLHLDPQQPYTRLVLEQGWGQSWGCFAVAPTHVTFDELRSHFRTLLRVQGPDGNLLVFRFYDPRVLRVYLPTCTTEERLAVFGPATRLVSETGTGHSLISYLADPAGGAGAQVNVWPSD